ncbi:MAG TPA: response regulator [Kofleriaceae bacterium]
MTKRILLVDDSEIVRAACEHALTRAGYHVETRDGIEDMGARGSSGFALILMDVQMPELFGDDVASVLRNDRDIHTPIYLFSTLPDAELRQRAEQAGIDGFIAKGEGTEHLVASVRKILGE